MKTPLRGEMLRGADFIIAVVSARGSDPFQTIFCCGARPANYSVHGSVAAVHALDISGETKTSILGNSDTQGVLTVVMQVRGASLQTLSLDARICLEHAREKKCER